MSNLIAAQMTKDQLAALLHDMLHGVEEGHVLEGNLEFLLADDGDAPDFVVRGAYRIDTRDGQSGLRIIGEVPSV